MLNTKEEIFEKHLGAEPKTEEIKIEDIRTVFKFIFAKTRLFQSP